MEHLTASAPPTPLSGEDWFDPLEDAIRFCVRAFIEAVVEAEAQAALGGRERYRRNGPPTGYLRAVLPGELLEGLRIGFRRGADAYGRDACQRPWSASAF